jgi:hypothetical protein
LLTTLMVSIEAAQPPLFVEFITRPHCGELWGRARSKLHTCSVCEINTRRGLHYKAGPFRRTLTQKNIRMYILKFRITHCAPRIHRMTLIFVTRRRSIRMIRLFAKSHLKCGPFSFANGCEISIRSTAIYVFEKYSL